jgi:hypothetical protein
MVFIELSKSKGTYILIFVRNFLKYSQNNSMIIMIDYHTLTCRIKGHKNGNNLWMSAA